MLFTYTAKLNTGEIINGILDGESRLAVARDLKSRGYFPLSVSEKSKIQNQLVAINSFFDRIKTAELIIMTKNLSAMLRAGLSLSRAISVLQKQTKNKTLNKVLISLNNEINGGGTLSSGLAKFPSHFSKLFISMTRAGEESGNLANALLEIGSNMEKDHALVRKVKGAMMYPAVIMVAMVVIGILMFAFVVPTLAGTFEEIGLPLPFTTKVIIWVGTFFSNNLILSFLIFFGGIAGTVFLFRTPALKKYIDYAITRIPVIGNLTKEINTARTARSMSSLLVAGVSITRAIEITTDVVQNIYYQAVLQDAIKNIEKGAPFSEVFKKNSNLYPVMMGEMVQVGEETGKLSEMLLQVALFYEGEVENKTKDLSTIIEPVLMVIIGVSVGFFAISMISPLYSVLDTIE